MRFLNNRKADKIVAAIAEQILGRKRGPGHPHRVSVDGYTLTLQPNEIAKLHFGAHQAPVDVYGLQILDATLKAGNLTEVEADTTALALLLKHKFLDGGAAFRNSCM